MSKNQTIGVIIPSYKVKKHILEVISKIGKEVHKIYVVDDKCPELSGEFVKTYCKDKRVKVLFHEENQGVGGAMVTGYKEAIKDNISIVVKIDGDEQMDPSLIPIFIKPILEGQADYTKGNRFFNLEFLKKMPTVRLIGNAGLSFITKISSGYWDMMDPTNGYTAIHVNILRVLPLNKIDKRYFFESDMLFRLNTVRAVVLDIPMMAKYDDEKSNLKVSKILFEFPIKHFNRFSKRIFYNFFLRDFNIGTINLIFGILLSAFGLSFGIYKWFFGFQSGIATPTGTVMLSILPIILGFQMILFFVNYDMMNVPKKTVYPSLNKL
jgi:dolichol-phosphate mannosyltransferase